jgi:tetratricopeptide (TPR) repeat protein
MYGEYDKGIAEIQKVLDMNPDDPLGLFDMGMTLAGAGKYEEAIATHKRLYEKNPDNPRWGIKWPLASSYALAGQRDEALEIVAEVEARDTMTPWHAFGLAVVYACLGDKEKSFQWLAFRPSHGWYPWIRVFPWFEPLWDDPRFPALLSELNLPPLE